MIIWTERILEISLESLIFGFFGDFRKFLKINNSRTAEDMKKILVPTVISRTRRFRKNGSFLNLSKIWWFMGGKSRDSLTPVLGTWSWTDFILTLHETSHIMWLSIYIIKSLATKFITRPWSFPCLTKKTCLFFEGVYQVTKIQVFNIFLNFIVLLNQCK